MIVPKVEQRFIGVMYRIFSYREDEIGLHLNFVEPMRSVKNEAHWKIEYRVRDRGVMSTLHLEEFIARLQREKGCFEWLDVCTNFDTRLYIYVLPSKEPFIERNEVKSVHIKGRKNLSSRIRDRKRAEEFSKKIAALEKRATELGHKGFVQSNNGKVFIPNHEKKKELEKFIRIAEKKLNYAGVGFKTVPDNDICQNNPALEHAEALESNVYRQQFKSDNNSGSEKNSMGHGPIAKLTAMSVVSEDQRYAKMRVLVKEDFKLIRMYLAILQDQDYSFVTTTGDTRMSIELRLKSEGLPIGKELEELYFKAVSERGYKIDEIKSDLLSLKSFEQTSRLIRIQTAREKTRSWCGLKGGASVLPAEVSYYTTRVEGAGTRDQMLAITDSLGEIQKFN